MATKRRYSEIHAALCAPDQFFEIETLDIRGVPTRTWKSAPATLAVMLSAPYRSGFVGIRTFPALAR